jgi:sugar phosphate isomerase/epimerase
VIYSLSTMWAQQERFADMHDFARAAQALGYDAIEVSHATGQEAYDRLTDGAGARLSSIHAPAPKVQVNGRSNSSLNLASLDAGERALAVEQTKRSIDEAARQGAGYVVVHLGGVGNEMLDAEHSLRRLFDAGTRSGDDVDAPRRECHERRAAGAEAHFEAAAQSLRELAAHAGERGVAIGLENRYHYHEIPSIDEGLRLLAGYPPERVGYWHDVGHAEVLSRLGLVDHLAWLPALGPRALGTHLHDVDGLADHRAPGNGDVDWSYIAAGLPPSALRVFEINQRQPDDAVAGAIAFLRERGVVE